MYHTNLRWLFPLSLFSVTERAQHYPTLDTSAYIGSYVYRYLPTLGRGGLTSCVRNYITTVVLYR